jgi:uncharacterized repeat protein (TIGR03803 family)
MRIREKHEQLSPAQPRAASTALALAVLIGSMLVATTSTQAQTFTVLHSFTGRPDGQGPGGGVVRDAAGNLYGTTDMGGPSNAGTVFKVDATGKEIVLYGFTGGADGGGLPAGLVRDAAGSLYGTTNNDGAFSSERCSGSIRPATKLCFTTSQA